MAAVTADNGPLVGAEEGAGARTARWTGCAASLFLTTVVLQNLVEAAFGLPDDASGAQILAFTRQHAWTVHLLFVTYVLGFPALLTFASGIGRLAVPRHPAAALPARIGQFSAGIIAVLFGLINVVQVTLVAARADLAGSPTLAHTLWAAHNALFTLNLVAIGGALFGLGTAAVTSGLVPRWLRPVVLVGAVALAASAMPIVAQVHGSPLFAVSVVGFVCWLAFLVVVTLRLLRAGADLRR
jgi:hypothetical protein